MLKQTFVIYLGNISLNFRYKVSNFVAENINSDQIEYINNLEDVICNEIAIEILSIMDNNTVLFLQLITRITLYNISVNLLKSNDSLEELKEIAKEFGLNLFYLLNELGLLKSNNNISFILEKLFSDNIVITRYEE